MNKVAYPEEYGSLPDHIEEEVEPICEGKTIHELRSIADYFNSKASELSRIAENDLTMEDFEKAKKKETSKELPTEEDDEDYD